MSPVTPIPILVTGGAGYIGSHTCKHLARHGFLPVVYDNLSHGHAWAVQWGPLELGDVTDGRRLQEVMAYWRPRAVIHFAAFIEVGESVHDPGRYYRNNTLGSLTLLESMTRLGLDNLVLSSTCAVYGLPEGDRLGEETPINPLNPYGRTKWIMEQMFQDFATAHGLRGVILRYFNACGADPEGELGEAHHPESHLIPRAIQTLRGEHACLELYGTDYPTPDGTAIRDYIHVMDLAQAHLLAVTHLLAGGGSAALNVGTGRGYSVREVIDAVARVGGRAVPVRECPRRPGDSTTLVADASRARALLGFTPRHTELEDMVATAWRWHAKGAMARP